MISDYLCTLIFEVEFAVSLECFSDYSVLQDCAQVCKGCNAHLPSSIIAPADSSSSDEPQMAHPQVFSSSLPI